jgi:alkylation response protein AidB-like acyl-CoA dehydrogenase
MVTTYDVVTGAAAPPAFTAAQELAAEMNRFLGDPRCPGTPFSYKEIVDNEELEILPPGAVQALRDWGLHRLLVPVALGGNLGNFEDFFLVARTVARRNMTIGVMYGSAFLGAVPVWLWGSDEQKRTLAKEILDGGMVAFGASEADHGSDISANETTARRDGDAYVLTGSKWPIGNATRARFVTILARTGKGSSFSLFLVDKSKVDRGLSSLPPVKTVGLRGHDLSGVTFDGCRVPASAVIGHDGAGLTQTLKLLQITRTGVAALSLGTMDAAVRIALSYSHERRLYGQPIYALPVIRDHLVKAHLDILIAECVAIPVMRALSVAPGRLSLWSSIAKYFVPVLAEEVLTGTARVLGARSYLREGVADGVFQKIQRDHAIASIFEGTTHANLANVAHQLPVILANGAGGVDAQATTELLTGIFSQTNDAPPWQPDGRRLRLTNEGQDEITQGWGEVKRQIAALTTDPGRPSAHRVLSELVAELDAIRVRCYDAVTRDVDWDPQSVRAIAAAEQHCVLHAASSLLFTWLINRDVLGGRFADAQWLVLCLHRLIQRLDPARELPEPYVPLIEERLFESMHHNAPFGILSL